MKSLRTLAHSAVVIGIALGADVAIAIGIDMAVPTRACAQAFSLEAKNETFGQVEGSKNVSQLIRSNAAHYWNYVTTAKETSGLRAYEGFRGIVAGDPHLGNFSVIPLTDSNGKRGLHEVNIDFDDAGVGAFAYDFARFVVTVKAIDKDVKIKALLDAYISGLEGQSVAAPQIINDLLATPISTYDRLESEYVDRKTKQGAFKLKEGELEAYSAAYSKKEIETLFPGETVLDLASRPKERGGSAEAERIWVYTKRSDGVEKIYELKGYQSTAMEKYTHQASPDKLVPAVRSVFWQGIHDDNYQLVQLGRAKKFFWLRDKKVALFDIPYNMEKPKNKQFIAEYAPYVASKLGQAHGSQKSGQAFLAKIRSGVLGRCEAEPRHLPRIRESDREGLFETRNRNAR
ncbi:MAG: hypothetical protein EOP05_05990 [Proteobacteria bacterium]|nr:MAG: hypothetical protein EOP05_05990 [Pseudomonadota bacterium]